MKQVYSGFLRVPFLSMFLDPFSIGFGSVWASQNPPKIEPKSTKNRCQNVFRCWLRFLTVFGRIFVVNPDPRTPKILKKSFVLQYLVEIRLFKLRSVLVPMLVPTWLHFSIKNGPKWEPRAIKKEVRFLIDFFIDFWTLLAPFWEPCWGHLGHLNR